MSSNVSRRAAHARSFYFDMGASLFNSGGGGPSQSWLCETYALRGVQWTGIFAWEAEHLDPVRVWSEIPGPLHPIYHWYNVPVNPEPEHPDNALRHLRAVARPEDFVVVKLDIDNTIVESALMAQILSDPALMGLIDELYFEHHVDTPPMYPYWGALPGSTLADTYAIFTTLRKRGVLAHSWV